MVFEGVEAYYKHLLFKASLTGSTASAGIKTSCRNLVVRSLRTLFKELQNVRVGVSSTHLCRTAVESNGLSLHCTLQELRAMKEF